MKYLTQKTKYKNEGNPNFKKGLPRCKLCDKELSDYHCKICKQCIIKNKEPIHFCKDCKIKISRNGIRCQSCHIKNLWEMQVFSSRKGTNNSNFRHGKTYNNRCIDCKKLLGNYRSKRCSSCAHKGKLSPLFGKITHGKGAYYKNIWMRSGYEIKYAKYLDKHAKRIMTILKKEPEFVLIDSKGPYFLFQEIDEILGIENKSVSVFST